MKLRVLGCSGGVGGSLRTTTLMIDDDILIDAGSGVGDLSLEEMRGIRRIFLTHSHMDHFAFLPLLVDSIFESIQEPIVVTGQPVTIEALKKHVFNWVIWPDFATLPTPESPVMRFETAMPGAKIELGKNRSLEMIRVNHIVPGVGYRVSCETGSFAFSGDTTTHDNLWDVLNQRDGLDLLIVEAAFPNGELELSQKAGHYTPDLLAADITKLKHQPKVYISHTKPGQEELIIKECQAAITDREINRLYGGEEFSF